jgi:hypothetical protein
MPIHRGTDNKGCFYQWGHQKKYYYKCRNKEQRKSARAKAIRQMVAIISYKNNSRRSSFRRK